jgi:hypothetical protein
MPRPILTAGVEQSNAAACHRIKRARLDTFEAIAQPTSEPKIFFLVGTTRSLWNDVIDL